MGVRVLDERLSCIAGMVPPCGLAADVGSDHGLLIASLVESGRVGRGIATDLNPHPLEKTRRLLRQKGLEGRVDTYLSDGLTGVPPDGLDTIVIAGMGGEMIFHIISSWPHSKNPGITWLLQPMTKAPWLRKALWEAGFAVRAEKCCHTGYRSYTVMLVRYAGVRQLYLGWQPYLGRLHPRTPQDRVYLAEYRRRLLAVAGAKESSGGPAEEAKNLKIAAGLLAAALGLPQ